MIGLIKRTMKFMLAVFFYYSGLLSLSSILKKGRNGKNNFTILMYHRVLDENDTERDHVQPALVVSRQVFEKQMAFLSRKYSLFSLEKLVVFLKKNQSPPPKSLAITFDDGWRDNYLYAYPIMKKYNLPATIFLTTDYMDSDDIFWFVKVGRILAKRKIAPERLSGVLERSRKTSENVSRPQSKDFDKSGGDTIDRDGFIEELKRFDHDTILGIIEELRRESDISSRKLAGDRQTLSWDEILEMQENGIDFGSHGCSHRILTGLDLDEVKRELIESKRVMEEKTGRSISLFAYPNGDFNEEIKELVRETGYDCAITTSGYKIDRSGPDLFALKRIGLHDGATAGPAGRFSKAIFACLLEGII